LREGTQKSFKGRTPLGTLFPTHDFLKGIIGRILGKLTPRFLRQEFGRAGNNLGWD